MFGSLFVHTCLVCLVCLRFDFKDMGSFCTVMMLLCLLVRGFDDIRVFFYLANWAEEKSAS